MGERLEKQEVKNPFVFAQKPLFLFNSRLFLAVCLGRTPPRPGWLDFFSPGHFTFVFPASPQICLNDPNRAGRQSPF
jgi:hypothetical protein